MNKSVIIAALLSALLSACASNNASYNNNVQQDSGLQSQIDGPQTDIETNVASSENETVLAKTMDAPDVGDEDRLQSFLLSEKDVEQYRVGPGDTLSISVFRVAELSKSYTISPNGQILLPLLGLVNISGLRLSQVEELLEQELGKELLNDPQVSAVIESYRPRKVTLVGAVGSPGLYQLSGNANLYELLSQAGGISGSAGDYLYIRTTQEDEETGNLRPVVLSVLVDDIYNPLSNKAFQVQQRLRRLVLNDGDWVAVDEAGSVFIDGRVESAGKYSIAGDLTMLQLLAEVGGPTFSGTTRKIRVVRKLPDGSTKTLRVNANKIRALEVPDFKLEKGDIITVGTNWFKLAFQTTFEYIVRIYYLFLVI